jgi:hypothetical protein
MKYSSVVFLMSYAVGAYAMEHLAVEPLAGRECEVVSPINHAARKRECLVKDICGGCRKLMHDEETCPYTQYYTSFTPDEESRPQWSVCLEAKKVTICFFNPRGEEKRISVPLRREKGLRYVLDFSFLCAELRSFLSPLFEN